ncbi:MAG: hypothetical protein MZV70_70605 [Desulfobacterales bacterium]|nr:hypothetical protein [Desulfobacterales bacterium]
MRARRRASSARPRRPKAHQVDQVGGAGLDREVDQEGHPPGLRADREGDLVRLGPIDGHELHRAGHGLDLLDRSAPGALGDMALEGFGAVFPDELLRRVGQLVVEEVEEAPGPVSRRRLGEIDRSRLRRRPAARGRREAGEGQRQHGDDRQRERRAPRTLELRHDETPP